MCLTNTGTTIGLTFMHAWASNIVGIPTCTMSPEPSKCFRSLSKSVLFCHVSRHFHIAFSDILKHAKIFNLDREPSDGIPHMVVHTPMLPSLRVKFVNVIPSTLSCALTICVPDICPKTERFLSECQAKPFK